MALLGYVSRSPSNMSHDPIKLTLSSKFTTDGNPANTKVFYSGTHKPSGPFDTGSIMMPCSFATFNDEQEPIITWKNELLILCNTCLFAWTNKSC